MGPAERLAAARELLGVRANASEQEVRRAFRQLTLRWHPERPGGDEARYAEITAAYELLLDPPAPPPPPPPRATVVVTPPLVYRLRIVGELAWRGGALELDAGGRPLRVRVPAGVELGERLPASLAGREAESVIAELDYSPWTRHGRDLHGELVVSLYDVLAGEPVDVPTPWGDVRLTLSRDRRPLRLRGRGIRREGQPPGDLLLRVTVELPEPDAALVAVLRSRKRPPRLA